MVARHSQSPVPQQQQPSRFDRATLEAQGEREIRRYADFYELSKKSSTTQILDTLFSDRVFIPVIKNDRSFRTAAVEGNILTRMGFTRAGGRQINKKTQNRLFNPHKSLLASSARKELNQPAQVVRTPTPEPTPPPPSRGFKRKSTLAKIFQLGRSSSKAPETIASTSTLEMETITELGPGDATTSCLSTTEPEPECAPIPAPPLPDDFESSQVVNVAVIDNANANTVSSTHATTAHPAEPAANQPPKSKSYGKFPIERFPSPSESYSDDDDDGQLPTAANPNGTAHPGGLDGDGDSLFSPGVRDSPAIGPFVFPPPSNTNPTESNWIIRMLADVERQRSNITSELEDAKAEVSAALTEVTLAQGELDEECECMQEFIEMVGQIAGNDVVSRMVRDAQNTATSEDEGEGDPGVGDGDGAEQAGGGVDNDARGEGGDDGGGRSGGKENGKPSNEMASIDEEEAHDGDIDYDSGDDDTSSSDDSDSDYLNPSPTFTLKLNTSGVSESASVFSQQAIPKEGTRGLPPSQFGSQLGNRPGPPQPSSHTQTPSTSQPPRKRSHGDSESSDEDELDTAHFKGANGSSESVASGSGRNKRVRRVANDDIVPPAPSHTRASTSRSPNSSMRRRGKMPHSSRANRRFPKMNNDAARGGNDSNEEEMVSPKRKRTFLGAVDGRNPKRTRSNAQASSSLQPTRPTAGRSPKKNAPNAGRQNVRHFTSNNCGVSSLNSGSRRWRPRPTSSSSSSSSDSACGTRETFALPPGLSSKKPLRLPSSPIVVPGLQSSPSGGPDVLAPSSSAPGGGAEMFSSPSDLERPETPPPPHNAYGDSHARSRARGSPSVLERPCLRPSECIAQAGPSRSSVHTPPSPPPQNNLDGPPEGSAPNANVPSDQPLRHDDNGIPLWKGDGDGVSSSSSNGNDDEYEPLCLRRPRALNGILSELGIGPEHYATSEPGPSRPRRRAQPLQHDRERVRMTESGSPETYIPEEEPQYADRMRALQQYLDEWATYHPDDDGNNSNGGGVDDDDDDDDENGVEPTADELMMRRVG